MVPKRSHDDCAEGVLRFDGPVSQNLSTESAANGLQPVTIPCYDSVRSPSVWHRLTDPPQNDQPSDDNQRSRQGLDARSTPPRERGSGRKAQRKSSPRLSRRMGLVVRGMSYYVRLSVPKSLQGIVGKREFVRSLRTNVLNEAIRKARLVSADFERWLADGAPPAVQTPAPVQAPTPVAVPAPPPATRFVKAEPACRPLHRIGVP